MSRRLGESYQFGWRGSYSPDDSSRPSRLQGDEVSDEISCNIWSENVRLRRRVTHQFWRPRAWLSRHRCLWWQTCCWTGDKWRRTGACWDPRESGDTDRTGCPRSLQWSQHCRRLVCCPSAPSLEREVRVVVERQGRVPEVSDWWPMRACLQDPVSTSHTLMLVSKLPDTTWTPSNCKYEELIKTALDKSWTQCVHTCRLYTRLVWPDRVCRHSSLSGFQTFTM